MVVLREEAGVGLRVAFMIFLLGFFVWFIFVGKRSTERKDGILIGREVVWFWVIVGARFLMS